MQNSNSYIIAKYFDINLSEKQICSDNKSRSALTLFNKGPGVITFGFLGQTGTKQGIRLQVDQGVTITEQYDGDFARVQLVAVATILDTQLSVFETMTYRETTR